MQNFYAPHLLVRGGRYSASGSPDRDTVFNDLRYMDGGRQTYVRHWRENEIVIYGASVKGIRLVKRAFKLCAKLLGAIAALLLVAVLGVSAFFGVKGYNMYKDAVEQMPMEELVEDIRSADNFIEYEELPDIYIDAVISAEDKRFFSHNGVDYIAIMRALINDIRTMSFAEGGSTITQQLMKNEYFTQKKTLERKFAEIFAAWELEDICDKEEIFELYVNTIYFGSGYYGIYDAAQGYYEKEPSELTEYEAIMLAGLPNAPSAYSPDTNPELARQRMKQVLNRMVECEVLSQTEADSIFYAG